MVKIVTSCAVGIAAVLLACCAHIAFSWSVVAPLVVYQEVQGASVVSGIYNDCVLRRKPDASVWEHGVPCTARTLYWLLKSGVAVSSGYAIVNSILDGVEG